MELRCLASRRRIRAAFVHGTLAPRSLVRLWAHLHRCEDCRSRYDRAIRLQRVMETGDLRLPSAKELDLLVPLMTPRCATLEQRRGWLTPRLLVPATALAMVVMVASTVLWRSQAPEDEWTTRSLGSATLGVRAFCETRDTGGRSLIRSLSDDPGPREAMACPADGTLFFSVISDEVGRLHVVFWDEDSPVWLLPESPEEEPLHVAVSSGLVPIPVEVGPDRLGSRARVTLSFVRTPTTVTADRVVGWLEAWHAGRSIELPSEVAIVERRVAIAPAQKEGEPR